MKFTRNADTVSNFEAVVIHDLREIGVKIPKIRKQSEHQIHAVLAVRFFVLSAWCGRIWHKI